MPKQSEDVVCMRGRRLYMRPVMRKDIPAMLRWINDEEVNQFLAVSHPVYEIEEAEWVDRLHKDKDHNIVFAIVDIKTGKPIGTMGLHRIDWESRTATTGALIGEKQYWGKGYGSEAKMLLLNYAFTRKNLRKICSVVIGFNGRSKAYSKKCGYKVEGVLKKHYFRNGRYWDQIHMAIFIEDWLPIWARFQKTGKV